VTEIEEITLETLTGAQVEHIRTTYGLSRRELALMCGFPATGVRIYNIEKKNSWKDGDREKVHVALTRIMMSPPRDKRGRQRGETGTERAERLDGMLRRRGVHANGGEDVVSTMYDSSMDDDDVLVQSPENGSPIDELERRQKMILNELNEEFGGRTSVEVRDITNSEIGVAQRCRRKWWLTVYRKLVLKQQDYMGHRARGNRVHRALAAWYVADGQERSDPREALERAIVDDWTAIVAQARVHPSYVDDDQSLGDLAARYQNAVTLERAMVEGYMEWLAAQGDDANFTVIAPESEVSAVIEGEVAGEKVSFRARALLDVRLRRKTDGVRMFEDHKTVGNFASKRKTLHMDPQMLHYHLLEFLNTPEGEARCDGAIYNMLRRVKRTPQAKEPFYERVEVHHNSFEIDAYRRRLMGAARDIMRMERELDAGADHMSVAYPHPMEDCSWSCDFFPVCPMFDDGSHVEAAIAALYEEQDPMARYDR